MPRVRIPTPLRVYTENQSSVEVEAETVIDALKALEERFPELSGRVLDEKSELKRYINIFVGSENIKDKDGLKTRLKSDDTVSIVPAIAGGS